MREAIGGAIVLKVALIFIVVINAYLALSVNYSKAFKVKNRVISLLEQYESYGNASGKIEEYLDGVNYLANITCPTGFSKVDSGRGVCGRMIVNDNSKGYYYQVITYINLSNIPLLGGILANLQNNPFAIKGETKTIYGEAPIDNWNSPRI